MVKSETRRDAETLVLKSESETSTILENPSPRLSAEKSETQTYTKTEPETRQSKGLEIAF